MKQSIVYKSRMGFFVFYRGGYDREKQCGLDPFGYDSDPVSTAKGFAPQYPVAHGQLISIFSVEDKIKVGRFFFGDKFTLESETDLVADGEFMLCFDANGRLVFYRKPDKAPVKAEKFCKTRNKFYKEWVRPYTEYGESAPPFTVRGYKFTKGQDYVVCSQPREYYQIIPEILRRPDCPKFCFGQASKLFEFLYELEPVDLSGSWDYSEEEKAVFETEIEKVKEEKRRYMEELEERKRTPGYCSVCGCEGAELREDPYAYDMYGTRNMVWLCPDCYHDAAMDV